MLRSTSSSMKKISNIDDRDLTKISDFEIKQNNKIDEENQYITEIQRQLNGEYDKNKVYKIYLSPNKDFLVAHVIPQMSSRQDQSSYPQGYLGLFKIDNKPLHIRKCGYLNLNRIDILSDIAFVGENIAIILEEEKRIWELRFYQYKNENLSLSASVSFRKAYSPRRIWPLPDGHFYLGRLKTDYRDMLLTLCNFDKNKFTVIADLGDTVNSHLVHVDPAGRLIYLGTEKSNVSYGEVVDWKVKLFDCYSYSLKAQTVFTFPNSNYVHSLGPHYFADRATYFFLHNYQTMSIKFNENSSLRMSETDFSVPLPPLYVDHNSIGLYAQALQPLPSVLIGIVIEYYPPRACHENSDFLISAALPHGVPVTIFERSENQTLLAVNKIHMEISLLINKAIERVNLGNECDTKIHSVLIRIFQNLQSELSFESCPSLSQIVLDAEQQLREIGVEFNLTPEYRKKYKLFGDLEEKPIVIQNTNISDITRESIQSLHDFLRKLFEIQAKRVGMTVKELRENNSNHVTVYNHKAPT